MKKIFTLVFLISYSVSSGANSKDKIYKFSSKKCEYKDSESYHTLAVLRCANKKTRHNLHPKPTSKPILVKKEIISPKPIKKPQLVNKTRQERKVFKRKHKEKTNSENRTQGHYVGIIAIVNELSFYERYSTNGGPKNNVKPSGSDKGYGLGLDYKYAFNFNKFFIAPGIFYEKLNTGSGPSLGSEFYSASSTITRLEVRDRYGLKMDVGYDMSQNISPYFSLGYSWVDYLSKNGGCLIDDCQSKLKHGVDGSIIYGLGMKFNYSKNLSFNIEGNIQKFVAKTDASVSNISYLEYQAIYRAKIKTIKIGTSYNF